MLVLILTTILSGCAKTNYEKPMSVINLPEMPIAGIKVADELKAICTKDKCNNINDWLNRLYVFRVQYLIYREELAK